MGLRFKSARLLMITIGILCLLFAIYYNQHDIVKDFLSRFLKYELAGYPE
ncbi:MAG: hypothetical protein Q6363_003410 [Candidatus Njordarchaeota archaeon]